ncbi:GlxA family transcriptional regulator [Oryzomonas japonica]|uniref:GlxA family transcriptional regulator n=1 Tax=Oryzomonas japonica TaxID=2603858 RepID=A0A7J4ZSK9_9BACT|nr:GlxA family transcriptional regulator [Oryzomonas japonica]KAB0666274.1 GlxA family transcriptional regulator [Oryzomonas japonica]
MNRHNQEVNGKTGTTEPRTVVVVVHEGCELLDATGPAAVFGVVNRTLREQAADAPGYLVTIAAQERGGVTTSAGVQLVADAAWRDMAGPIDTLLVVGSPDEPLGRAVANRELIHWLAETGGRVRRLVSVCTGAFLLAEAGLLNGRRVTTHWMDVDRMAREYPEVTVEPDAIYVRDGSIATSAGITAGIDLALALVEEDYGRKLALAIARRLVLYLKRPGGQSQFSSRLRSQMVTGGPLAQLLAWLEENAHQNIAVEDLADRAAMSPRNFARVFLRETGMTPSKYLDRLRIERAKHLLEETNHPMETVARESGFSGAEQLRRTFQRCLGITPRAYRERF